MADLNSVKLRGNVGFDPIEHNSGGYAIVSLSVATNSSWKDKNGEWQKQTEWHRVTAFGKRAEWCIRELKKGSRVEVEGQLQTNIVEGNNGQRRYFTQVIAKKIGLA